MKKTGPKKVFEFKSLLRSPSSLRSLGAKGLLAGVAALGLAAAYLGVCSAPSWATVAGTKHNFGSLSTAAIKTQDTSEICVFCHTPHNSRPSTPLWNKADTGSTYNVYASQTLAATLSPNAPTLGQPTGSSKLCLACHDGTIAIGSLLNGPGADQGVTVNVAGPGVTAGGTIASTSTSYIGTDLRDDHPISFSYGLSYPSNPEIKAPTALPPEVKIDSAGRVQCTSCHDPHGTAFPKFMVATLENGALCTACHDKRYWTTMPSVHKTSAATWNGLGVNPWSEDMGLAGFTDDNTALQSCLSCHKSHGGVAGKELLKGTNPLSGLVTGEEWTCLNCHNGNVAAKNVEPAFNYLYRHDVKGVYGAHVPSRVLPGDPVRETAANLGASRHAECADCHNGHGAKAGSHVPGSVNGNIIGANGLGGWGVKPAPWAAAGTAAATYTVVDFVALTPGTDNFEGYMCIKCHSYYAYGLMPPTVPSGNADGSLVYQSDPTADFNINNMSVHPVFSAGKNTPLVTANPNWPLNSLGLTNTFRYLDFPGIGARTGYYNMTHDSTVTCSDCHGSSTATDPSGVHGSNNKWILKGNVTGVGSMNNFCYNCHRRDVYGDEGYLGPNANYSRVTHPVDGLGLASPFYTMGASTGNTSNKFGNLCLSCHGGSHDATSNTIKGAHGSNAAAGALVGSDPLGYRMMNGACVESHKRATTLTGVQMNFRAVTPATDKVCNYNFTNFIGNIANYSCNTIASCVN